LFLQIYIYVTVSLALWKLPASAIISRTPLEHYLGPFIRPDN